MQETPKTELSSTPKLEILSIYPLTEADITELRQTYRDAIQGTKLSCEFVAFPLDSLGDLG